MKNSGIPTLNRSRHRDDDVNMSSVEIFRTSAGACTCEMRREVNPRQQEEEARTPADIKRNVHSFRSLRFPLHTYLGQCRPYLKVPIS